jgi:hypothetical protein
MTMKNYVFAAIVALASTSQLMAIFQLKRRLYAGKSFRINKTFLHVRVVQT